MEKQGVTVQSEALGNDKLKKVPRKFWVFSGTLYLVLLLQSGEQHSLLHTQISVNHPQ